MLALNATVILNSMDYRTKMGELLSDPSNQNISKDLTRRTEKQGILLIKAASLPSVVEKQVVPHSSQPPRFYGLPKIHKSGIPLQLIASCIRSPTYELAKYLAELLKPWIGTCEQHIKNAYTFAKSD